MIPADWRPFRRETDEELVGYLVDGADGVVATSLIGLPLSGPTDELAARVLLAERGLASLDAKWRCRLPSPLPRGVDVTRPRDDWPWRIVVVVETSPAECRIRPAMAYPEELNSTATLPVPVGALLQPPE